ncbi:MAG: nickel-dependent hydrogenase large subunit [Pseudomonadota bacterium]
MAQPRPPESHACHVDFLARVEGETSILVKTKDGAVEEIKLKIFEPPRFFEGFLAGRKYSEVGDIVARICGICPISHMTTAIQAVEDAMGITPSLQTKVLRRLICLSQIVASHLVHLYMFALPDYFGHPGFFTMMHGFEKEKNDFLQMKTVMNKIGEIIGGRPLHPIALVVGGFTRIPSRESFDTMIREVEELLPMAGDTVRLFSGLPYPEINTQAEFVALHKDGEYAVNEGHVVSSGGIDLEIRQYPAVFHEEQQDYAMAKKSYLKNGGSIMSGALARLNLKFAQLPDHTQALAREVGFRRPDRNPYHNNPAQALEVHGGMMECIRLLQGIDLTEEAPQVEIREGEGISITEAPRGLLMHSYAIDRSGAVRKANVVTPTSHNFANIERDLHSLAENYAEKAGPGDLKSKCEQLVRAYDPCFSCSVH